MRDSSDTYLPKEISLVWVRLFEFNFLMTDKGFKLFFFLGLRCLLLVATPVFVKDVVN